MKSRCIDAHRTERGRCGCEERDRNKHLKRAGPRTVRYADFFIDVFTLKLHDFSIEL